MLEHALSPPAASRAVPVAAPAGFERPRRLLRRPCPLRGRRDSRRSLALLPASSLRPRRLGTRSRPDRARSALTGVFQQRGGRDVRRAGPLSPRLAGSCEPGPAASRRGRLRVLYGELSRPLTFGLFVVRPRLLPRGPRAPRLAGSFGPGLAHSRRGSLGVLHVSFFDLSLSASSMRGRGFCHGGLAPLG